MKTKFFITLCLLIFIITSTGSLFAQEGRWEQDLSGPGWSLYLDRDAEWQNDTLYLHPVDLSVIQVKPPSCGWENLSAVADKRVEVPGTVEGYFWSVKDSTGSKIGDYRGISWWSTTFDVPAKLKGKRLTLAFQSVNLRAEVFVNHQLIGYDLIGNTPFEVNITDVANYGGSNNLDIRITDIGGTFSWDDANALHWGEYTVPSVHGFGGITGKVVLSATDKVHVDDIYVQNQVEPTNVNVNITLENMGDTDVDGDVDLVIRELQNPQKIFWSHTEKVVVEQGVKKVVFKVSAPNAKLWRVKDPHLYVAEVKFTGVDGKVYDVREQKFGFRWFDVGEKDGDKRFYLNGKRVFIIGMMTRGFWPKMGMFPIQGMAERDIRQVISLGYNMIMYHRAIGQPSSMDLCDDLGILSYEETGGYQSLPYPPSEFAQQWRKEKLRRMIIRDRSRASLTNWNLDSWSRNEPNDWDYENIQMVRLLDPSRIVTFNQIQNSTDSIRKKNPFQLHMLPFDSTYYYDGWYDPFHFAAQSGYVDEYYNHPKNYARYALDPDRYTLGDSINPVPKDQIYFLAEEGAFGTQLNLARIKKDLQSLGSDGWMDGEYLDWYNSYDTFLNEADMRDAFPTVEDLTTKMGHNLHYYHGRIIENTRMMNIADAYVLNGWAGAETNTDIVDTYRHPTGDSLILPHYSQALYVAVKIRNKVIPVGTTPVADIFLINEEELSGPHKLNLTLKSPDGDVVFSKTLETEVLGGEEFGQLLTAEVMMPKVEQNGYYKLDAKLEDLNGLVCATGSDDLFVADYTRPDLPEDVVIVDESGAINSFMKLAYGVTFPAFDPTGRRPSAIVLGKHNMNTLDIPRIMTMVESGTRLLILENAQKWISKLPVKQLMVPGDEGGSNNGKMIGRQFIGNSSFFKGLPQATAMSWEYQVFYRENRNGGLGLPISPEGLNTIVGVGPTNTGAIGIALCQMPYGQGYVILSSLNIVPNLIKDRPDCAVAKKLFMNLIENNLSREGK